MPPFDNSMMFRKQSPNAGGICDSLTRGLNQLIVSAMISWFGVGFRFLRRAWL